MCCLSPLVGESVAKLHLLRSLGTWLAVLADKNALDCMNAFDLSAGSGTFDDGPNC